MQVLIWGTGVLCGRVVSKISDESIIGYIDSRRKMDVFAGKPLYSPDELGGGKV